MFCSRVHYGCCDVLAPLQNQYQQPGTRCRNAWRTWRAYTSSTGTQLHGSLMMNANWFKRVIRDKRFVIWVWCILWYYGILFDFMWLNVRDRPFMMSAWRRQAVRLRWTHVDRARGQLNVVIMKIRACWRHPFCSCKEIGFLCYKIASFEWINSQNFSSA